MSRRSRYFNLINSIFITLALFPVRPASADYDQRLSLGVGFADIRNPNEMALMVGGEYEKRLNELLGLGAGVQYIFSNPGITYVAVPDLFVHPFGTEFLVSAAPLLEFGPLVGTNVGAQLGTRLPIPLGPVSLVPSFAVDLISGGPSYIFGMGIEF